MERPVKMDLRMKTLLATAAVLAPPLLATPAGALEPTTIVVLDFDYSDSSGEPRDQEAVHQARLGAFAERIRAALAASGAYRVVPAQCPARPCSAKNYETEELFDFARRAGAKLMLFGGVHKMSTLVQWARVELVDVAENRLVDDRHLSFRGDDEDSWRRAADYVARKMTKQHAQEERPE